MKPITTSSLVVVALGLAGATSCRLDRSTKTGCMNDTDCMGDRVCVDGECTAPTERDCGSTTAFEAGTTDGASPAAVAEADASVDAAAHAVVDSGIAADRACVDDAADAEGSRATDVDLGAQRDADDDTSTDADSSAWRDASSIGDSSAPREDSEEASDSGRTSECGNPIVSRTIRTIQSLRFYWLGRSCGAAKPADVVFTLNEEEVARIPLADSCDCEPGIGVFDVADPAKLSLGRNGPNVFRAMTTGDLSWATVLVQTPTMGGEFSIWAAWPSNRWNEATNHPPDLCNSVQSGLSVSGVAMALFNGEEEHGEADCGAMK